MTEAQAQVGSVAGPLAWVAAVLTSLSVAVALRAIADRVETYGVSGHSGRVVDLTAAAAGSPESSKI